jgi:hypothetical protein
VNVVSGSEPSFNTKVVIERSDKGCISVYVSAEHAYRYSGDEVASAAAAICQVADCGVANGQLVIWNRVDSDTFDELVERVLANGWHMLAEHDDHVRLRRTAAAA